MSESSGTPTALTDEAGRDRTGETSTGSGESPAATGTPVTLVAENAIIENNNDTQDSEQKSRGDSEAAGTPVSLVVTENVNENNNTQDSEQNSGKCAPTEVSPVTLVVAEEANPSRATLDPVQQSESGESETVADSRDIAPLSSNDLVFNLDETEEVKRKIREMSDRQQTLILAGLSCFLFALLQVAGWIPTTAAIFYVCGMILLTKYTKLSNQCQVEGTAAGLQLSLIDAVGKSSLMVPREKIESVKKLSDAYEVTLSNDFLSLPQRLVFRSLLRNRTEAAAPTRTSDNANLPAKEGSAHSTVVRIPLVGMPSESDRTRLLSVLQSLLPDGHSVQEPEREQQQELSEINDGTTRVAYNPNKVAKDAAAKWMRKNNWKVSVGLFILGLGVTLSMPIHSTFVGMMLVGLVCFLAALHEKERPTYVGFSADGIAFIWSRKTGETRGVTIPWECVSHVSSFCSTGRKLFDTMIDIRLIPEKLTPIQRMMFGWMMPEYFDRSGPLKLRLRAGGLENAEARHNLLDAFKRYLPADRVEDEVYKVLNPTDPDSYTTLWLQSLGNAPRRFSEGHLPGGYVLDNGRYEILSMLGAGGQATAYLAKERTKDGENVVEREIVLKEFILPSHAGAELSARSLEHIKREHELIKRIHNSQVVEYYGLFVEDHRAYLILEHVDGPSLRQLVEKNGPVSKEQALDLASQMAEILCHLHSQSPPVVHRDFTPENLLLGKDGRLKLIDFNVAQELETSATRTIVGKHSYIPPEQFRGKPVPQSDIYAMGAGLHFLLTGEEPEPISVSHPIIKRPEIGGDFDNLVARATNGDLSKRYADAKQLQEDLVRIIGADSEQNLNEVLDQLADQHLATLQVTNSSVEDELDASIAASFIDLVPAQQDHLSANEPPPENASTDEAPRDTSTD